MALTNEQILQILNETYESLGWAQSGANKITEENISKIGVLSPNMVNQFMEQLNVVLENRFWKSIFEANDNAMRSFAVDIGKNGWGILDTFQEFIAGSTPMWDESFTDTDRATDLVTPVAQKIKKKYHTSPMQIQFKNTINRRETDKVFTMAGAQTFINNVLGLMTASFEYWLLTEIATLLKDVVTNGEFVEKTGYSLVDKDNIKKFVWHMRAMAKDMTFPTTLYNKDGVRVSTINSKVYFLTNHYIDERINVYGLADTFNEEKADVTIEKLYIPSDVSIGEDVLGVILDRRSILFGIRTYAMTHFRVSNTLWDNYWLSAEGMKSYNTFFNAVVMKGTVEG